MRSAIATVLALALVVVVGYAVWRAFRARRHRPVGDGHPRWRTVAVAVIALFVGIAVFAPSDEANQRGADGDAVSSRATSEADETASATATSTPSATPTATPTARPTPTAAERRRAARLRRQAAARKRAQARARRQAKARARQRARERRQARARRAAERLRRERERNTSQLQAGVTCDELGETNIPVIPGAEIDADNDGVGCED